MHGAESVLQARLDGLTLDRIDIDLTGVGRWYGVENCSGSMVGILLVEPIETAPRCDLRGVRGLPVAIFAPSYQRGLPFLDACMEHGASRVSLLAPDEVVTYDGKELKQWEM